MELMNGARNSSFFPFHEETNEIEKILLFHHDIAKQVVGQMESFSKEEPNRKIIDKQHFTVIAKYLSHE